MEITTKPQTLSCQHFACGLCWENAAAVAHERRCHLCRKPYRFGDLAPHLAHNESLERALVKCQLTCGWTGPAAEADDHDKVCPLQQLENLRAKNSLLRAANNELQAENAELRAAKSELEESCRKLDQSRGNLEMENARNSGIERDSRALTGTRVS